MRRWPEKQYLAWSAKSEAKGVDGRTSNVAFPLERDTLLLYRERERGDGKLRHTNMSHGNFFEIPLKTTKRL